jgi:uncharacterized protein
MNEVMLADAGPVVAYLDRDDAHHAWARDQMAQLTEPLLTCEAVMTEAWHLLRRARINPDHLLALVTQGALVVDFDFMQEAAAIRTLTQRYRSVPISFADACLVRMSEMQEKSRVFTVDSDFSIYRRHGRKTIPVLAPFAA